MLFLSDVEEGGEVMFTDASVSLKFHYTLYMCMHVCIYQCICMKIECMCAYMNAYIDKRICFHRLSDPNRVCLIWTE